jgi:hypothetical protein
MYQTMPQDTHRRRANTDIWQMRNPSRTPDQLDVDHWAGKLFLLTVCLIGFLFWIVVLLGILT